MVKQADHNSPLVKGQSGVAGGREGEAAGRIYIFTILLMQVAA